MTSSIGTSKLADGRQEAYSENFVKDAMTMYERILKVPSLGHITVEEEKRDDQNSPWNNIGKFVALASSTADQEDMKLVMDSLEDYQTNQSYASSDLSPTYCRETSGMWASFPC